MNHIIDKLIEQDRTTGMTRGRKLGRTAVAGLVLTAGVAGGFSSEGRQVVDTGVNLVKDIATAVVDGPPDTQPATGSEAVVSHQELSGTAAGVAAEPVAVQSPDQAK